MNPTDPEQSPKSKHEPVHLGSWTLPSGNQCETTLVPDLPVSLTIRFSWASPPTGKDRDDLAEELRRRVNLVRGMAQYIRDADGTEILQGIDNSHL